MAALVTPIIKPEYKLYPGMPGKTAGKKGAGRNRQRNITISDPTFIRRRTRSVESETSALSTISARSAPDCSSHPPSSNANKYAKDLVERRRGSRKSPDRSPLKTLPNIIEDEEMPNVSEQKETHSPVVDQEIALEKAQGPATNGPGQWILQKLCIRRNKTKSGKKRSGKLSKSSENHP